MEHDDYWLNTPGSVIKRYKDKVEKDPNGLNPKQPGAKLDGGKSPVFQGLLDYFPRACMAVAAVSAAGAEKYAWKGWEAVPDGVNRYRNASGRHIVKEAIEGPWDSEMMERGHQILHLAQVCWNDLAALELYLRENENKTE